MVDAPNTNPDPQQPVVPTPTDKPASFFSSTLGKVVIGGVALVVVLAVIGTLLWVFWLGSSSSQDATQVPGVVMPSGSAPATSAAGSDGAPVTEPQQKPLESTFTFRNVFAPTLKKPTPPSVVDSITAPATSTADGDDDGSTSTGDIDVPEDTLYLVSIQTVDGEKTATFIWNDATYTLEEGDTLTGTPWEVVEIGESSVVMLFGDTQVTLTTGQGLSK